MPARPSPQIAVDLARRGLAGLARAPRVHRVLDLVQRELQGALFPEDHYDGRYYGTDRDSRHRGGLSGYERYDRDTSNANAAAYLVWRSFPTRTHLDVGCATGFVVEALRELGIDAWGSDISGWAVDHATSGALGRLRRGDLTKRLPYRSGLFDSVTALETLEHLPPEAIPHAMTELRRVCRGYLIATIPSFGPRDTGPAGWFEAKLPDEVLDRYRGYGPDYEGPVPLEDLARDIEGNPIEGHLTIASFSWWRNRFVEAGFIRMPDLERSLQTDLEALGLDIAWNLYAFRVPEAPEPRIPLLSASETRERAGHWGLSGLL
jgi:SAM-dependent methyltransferase